MKAIGQTERLILRNFVPDDVQPLMDVLGNPRVMRFSLRGPHSRRQVAEWLDRRIRTSASGLPTQYAVLRGTSLEFLGFSGFLPFEDPDGEAEHEISYRFRPACWNQGIGTEALQACLKYGFTHFKFAAVLAVVEEANAASVRVLEKVGMQYVKDTLYHDIPVQKYLITRENFQPMNALDKQ
jgi:RimJ/RimL family protein N-acetyltransferase